MAFSIYGPEKIPRKETGESYTILNELRNFVRPRRLQAVGCGAECRLARLSQAQTMNGLAWLSICSALPECYLTYIDVA